MAKAAARKSTVPAAERRPALAGRKAATAHVRIEALGPAARLSLRAPAESVQALSKALGVTVPAKPKSSASNGTRTALWLGPDEWLVIDADGRPPMADLAAVKALHSAVDVSHRNVAIAVSGSAAAATLNGGCPQDLSLEAFPVGVCSRTVLGKIEIVLLRTGEEEFRVECWRSFSDYAFTLLTQAAGYAAA